MFRYIKKGLCLVIILSLMSLFSACSESRSESAATGKIGGLTKEQWIQDIDYLKENLEKKHKNVYHTITKEELDKQYNELKKNISTFSDYEIKIKLAEIVASIGDGHTALNIGFQEEQSTYPLGVWWFGEDLKVYAIDKEYKDVIGKTLIAINNISIEEIMNKINALISHENKQWLKVLNVKYVNMEEVLRALKITSGNEAEFIFSDDEGNETKVTLMAKVLKSEDVVTVKDLRQQKPVSMQYDENDPYWGLYWYKYIPEDKIMYFQYNQCIDRDTARMAGYDKYEEFPEFDKFTEGLIKELNEKEVDKFVIDLRNNTGGNSTLMSDFVGELYDVKKLREQGKIFVLTGRETYSSGVMACTTLKKSTKALFFGESTGGNVNGYGEVEVLTLPNSKLQVSYSVKYFELDSKYKEGFTPDIAVEQSFDSYMKGIDDVYEAVRSYGK